MAYIDRAAHDIARDPQVKLIGGELISDDYLNDISEEVDQLLGELGVVIALQKCTLWSH